MFFVCAFHNYIVVPLTKFLLIHIRDFLKIIARIYIFFNINFFIIIKVVFRKTHSSLYYDVYL